MFGGPAGNSRRPGTVKGRGIDKDERVVKIREAVFPDDLPMLRSLMTEYLLDFDPRSDPARIWDEQYYAACLQAAAGGTLIALLAQDDGEPFGFAILRLESPWYRPSLRLGSFEEVYVRAEHRRRGLARRMVASGEEWFRRHGAHTWTASVLEENPEALDFWQSVGFEARVRKLYRP
jgi:GNAT superfamily N-acetyltransferase